MTANPTLIVNARLVNEGREFDGDLRFEDGHITAIGSGLSARGNETVVDAAGRRLLPGMIDDQVHFREPGMEYKADMAIESGAAVAGGLTRFMDMPNTSPPTLDAEALENKYQRAAGRVRGNYGFYMGTSTTNLEHIQRLDPLTAPGVKVFMGASTGNMLVDDPEVLDAVFRDVPTPIITHCEDTPMIEAATAAPDSTAMSALYSMPGSRKCTWSSIMPGSRRRPAASTTVSPARASRPVPISAMRPSAMRRSPSYSRPSLTSRALTMRVALAVIWSPCSGKGWAVQVTGVAAPGHGRRDAADGSAGCAAAQANCP